MYMKRFLEKELGCYHPVAEDISVDVWLHDMIGDYNISQEPIFLFIFVADGSCETK